MLIDITICYNDTLIARCNYMKLMRHANGFVRTIAFRNLKKTDHFEKVIHELYFEKVEIKVFIQSPFHQLEEYIIFEMLIFNDNPFPADEWVVDGSIFIDPFRTTEYYWQPTIDVLNLWQNNKSCNDVWFTKKATPDFKQGYLSACLLYSGVSTKIPDRFRYEIDWRMIKDEHDFAFLMSEAILGEKGYLGGDIRTFKDCINLIIENDISFAGREMIFEGGVPNSNKLKKMYHEVYTFLGNAGFILLVR